MLYIRSLSVLITVVLCAPSDNSNTPAMSGNDAYSIFCGHFFVWLFLGVFCFLVCTVSFFLSTGSTMNWVKEIVVNKPSVTWCWSAGWQRERKHSMARWLGLRLLESSRDPVDRTSVSQFFSPHPHPHPHRGRTRWLEWAVLRYFPYPVFLGSDNTSASQILVNPSLLRAGLMKTKCLVYFKIVSFLLS